MSNKSKKSSQSSDIESQTDVSADGGFLTGPVLVGGAKLTWEVGKDLYARLKPDKKFFCQVIDSSYKNKHHLVKVRIASACVHGIYIESIHADAIKPRSLEIFGGNADVGRMGFGGGKKFSESQLVKLPYLLEPNGALDVILRFPEVNDSKVTSENGLEMRVCYCVLDKLGGNEENKWETRLRWS
jgi:hypothetical protein